MNSDALNQGRREIYRALDAAPLPEQERHVIKEFVGSVFALCAEHDADPEFHLLRMADGPRLYFEIHIPGSEQPYQIIVKGEPHV